MDMINIYIASIIAVITVLIFYIRRRFTFWSRQGVPGPNYIALGAFLNKHHDYNLIHAKMYGRIYGMYELTNKSIVINEPDLIKDIFVKDFNVFPDHKHFNLGTSSVARSLFFLPGDEDWKRIRSILSPTFTSGKLKLMMHSMAKMSDRLVDNFGKYAKNGQTVDVRKYIGAFAMDVISSCAYGINPDAINNPEHPIVVNVKKILGIDLKFQQLVSLLAPPIGKFFNFIFFDEQAVNYFDKLTDQLVEERKNSSNTGNSKRTDFLQLMIDQEKNDSDSDPISDEENFNGNDQHLINQKINIKNLKKSERSLSKEELTAQGVLFFIAGYDTTSASLSHAIYYLAKDKNIQQKLFEELKTLNNLSYESLNQLEYLNAVINETLRLAPSLTRVERTCVKDYKLGNTGITIPAGTSVTVLPYALHRDPEFFPEPEVFKPERFIASSGEPVHHPYAFLPFGGGPRICIGMRFAMNEMRMCLGKLILNYEFNLVPDFKIDYFSGNILLSPKTLMVNIKARS